MEASQITGGLIFKYIDENDGIDYYEKGARGSFRIVTPRQKRKDTGKKKKEKKTKKGKKNKK